MSVSIPNTSMSCSLPQDTLKTSYIFMSFLSFMTCVFLLLKMVPDDYQPIVLALLLMYNLFVISMYQTNGLFDKNTFESMTNFQKFTVVANTVSVLLIILFSISSEEIFPLALQDQIKSLKMFFSIFRPEFLVLFVAFSNLCNISFICHA
jgi:hypothetical protein